MNTGSGQKLWERAKELIPGGNQLLSKRPELYLPEGWPTYFIRAKGCEVWDLDGNHFHDLLFAVGTNTLGYGHPQVDDAVREAVTNGNMSSLNCPEEVELAERVVGLHPWAEMARFARSGGEANAIAIRIARTFTGKDQVAVCGYHGWHDWYLSANLGDEDCLKGHLLPGLEPNGVPESLRGTVHTFQYNRFDQLEQIVAKHDIGVIKMEVSRAALPENQFLENVRDLATKKDIVLIFDECSSGFREAFGGLHLNFGVEPDLCVLGKALGNGYAITSVVGKRRVMEAARDTFISSTFWTERIGSAAGVATLQVMEETSSWKTISKTGEEIKRRWLEMAARVGISIAITGVNALPHFKIESPRAMDYKTLISQEMLKRGYLAATNIYISLAHTPEVIEGYLEALRPVFEKIAECENGRAAIEDLLQAPVSRGTFDRLA